MVIVIGTTTVDLLISGLDRIPGHEGDEFTSTSLAFCDQPLSMVLGGNGANSAYALASLGVPTALCSAVGRDRMGALAAEWLSSRDVNLRSFVRHETAASATTTVILDHELNRIAFHHAGANRCFDQTDIDQDLFREAEALLFTGYPLLPQFHGQGLRRVLETARQNGAITALDIGPAIDSSVTVDDLRPLLPLLDYLIANEYELRVCTGESDLEAGIRRLLAAGAANVVIKRGEEGAVAGSSDSETLIIEPAVPVEARFSVGAGDSFNAGLLCGLLQEWDLARAIRFGNATASLVVSTSQGILGCPTREQVQAVIDAAVSDR